MDSLEDVDLARSLNFSSSLHFLSLVEEDLAGLVLAAQAVREPSGCHATFPPLKPRYASLLQVAAARFGLRVTPHGWGDERRLSVEASPGAALPCVQCSDFRPLGGSGSLARRLAEVAQPSRPLRAAEAGPSQLARSSPSPARPANGGPSEAGEEPPGGGSSSRGQGGMRGWSDGEESDDNWIAKRRRASTAAGRATKGRGFTADGGEDTSRGGTADPEDSVSCALQKDYTKYAIDPNDTWSPHRKPYTELTGSWEFSGAWSFDPDENEQREEERRHGKGLRGVAAWRVEHAKGGDFAIAFAEGHASDARRWLDGSGRGRGEEPFVLEFRLIAESACWEYRFGRASRLKDWKRLPWSNAHRTSFWAATLPGEDGKQHLLAGLDEFPERRFLFAKVRLQPKIFGFGPASEATRSAKAFYVRDVVVFGRMSLLPPPFATRDHFVELAGKSRDEALEALSAASLGQRVAMVLQSPKGGAVLLVCHGREDAQAIAGALAGAVAVRSSEWTWPPAECEDGGVAAAQAHRASSQACWTKLHLETTRELAIFEEHLHRRTKHLEGVRIARTSAARMILGNLRGEAPLPKPPEAGV